jgi:hypothetical protein
MVGKQTTRAVNSTRDSRCHGLVDGDGTSTALMGWPPGASLLVPIGLFSLAVAVAFSFSLSFLVTAQILMLLLHGAVSVLHVSIAVAVAVVRRTAAAPEKVLVVHALFNCPSKDRQHGDCKMDADPVKKTSLASSIAGSEPNAVVGGGGGFTAWTKGPDHGRRRMGEKKAMTATYSSWANLDQ